MGPDELGQRRHAGQHRRAAHRSARSRRRWTAVRGCPHGSGVLGPGRGRRPQAPDRPPAGRPDRRADHDARLRGPLPARRDRLPHPGHLGLRRRVRRPAGGPRRRHDRRPRGGHRRGRHRHGVPPQLLGPGARRRPRAGDDPRHDHRDRPARRHAAALGRPGRGLAGARARPARVRPRQGLGARPGARRRRPRRPRPGTGDGPPGADRAARRDRRPAARADPVPAGARGGRPVRGRDPVHPAPRPGRHGGAGAVGGPPRGPVHPDPRGESTTRSW